jgi:hypothetical protein
MVYNAPDRVGGALVLDFVNTREAWLRDGPHHEYMGDYEELWAWAGEGAPSVVGSRRWRSRPAHS